MVDEESGRYACTHWTLIENLGSFSLLKFKLDTGRTHQIRVHSAHIGHPIIGDQTYSRCKKLPIKLSGQALHAFELGLIHPITLEKMKFTAPLPEDFERLLKVLQPKNNINSEVLDMP